MLLDVLRIAAPLRKDLSPADILSSSANEYQPLTAKIFKSFRDTFKSTPFAICGQGIFFCKNVVLRQIAPPNNFEGVQTTRGGVAYLSHWFIALGE
jgi:hypothetical protein